MMSRPVLRDPFRRYTVGPDRDDLGSQLVHRAGFVIGVYVDDQDTGLDGSRTQGRLVSEQLTRHHLVLAGIRDGGPFRGAVNLKEWYPYPGPSSKPGGGWDGYITQWDYALPGENAPPALYRWRLYWQAWRQAKHRPRIVLIY